jgi:hypothetical protein
MKQTAICILCAAAPGAHQAASEVSQMLRDRSLSRILTAMQLPVVLLFEHGSVGVDVGHKLLAAPCHLPCVDNHADHC